jgi:hypothetical protein
MELTDEIREVIRRHGLEEDMEHVIIPLPDQNGHRRRCFLLKRRFLRIVYPDGLSVDYPLEEVIEATIKYPELLSSEALYLLHKELDAEISKIFDDKKEVL